MCTALPNTMAIIIIAIGNIIIGGLVGMTGVAGFLLPILYTAGLGYSTTEGLAFSFLAFIISGWLGSRHYQRQGLMDRRIAYMLSGGSFVGAILGVRLNLLLPTSWVQLLLYLVVLLSGIAILIQQRYPPKPGVDHLNHPILLVILGIVTGLICALSGAGGPVLVMPLLVLLGCEPHAAVGIALLNSVFISLPAAVGYLSQIQLMNTLPLLAIILVTHGLGVIVGSRLGPKIDGRLLKNGTAIFSIILGCIKLWP